MNKLEQHSNIKQTFQPKLSVRTQMEEMSFFCFTYGNLAHLSLKIRLLVKTSNSFEVKLNKREERVNK